MRKNFWKIVTGIAVCLISIPVINSETNETLAQVDDSSFFENNLSKDDVEVLYSSGTKKINLIKQPILLMDQLNDAEQKSLTISVGNLESGIERIKDYINSPSGLIRYLSITSKNNNVSIKNIEPLFSKNDLTMASYSNGFNFPVLVRLSNWEEITFTLPVVINRSPQTANSAPILQGDPAFLINPTVSTSKEGYSLVNGLSAWFVNQSKILQTISTDNWLVTSPNGTIKNDFILDVSKPGSYLVNYQITSPTSGQSIEFSRRIVVSDTKKNDDQYFPIYQANLYPVNKNAYVNYVQNYGIMLYDGFGASAKPLNRYLPNGSEWKVLYSVVDERGVEWFCLGRDQWAMQQYFKFSSNYGIQNADFVAEIVNSKGANLYNGYGDLKVFSGRVLATGTKWKVNSTIRLGDDSLWYNLGANQWVDAKDTK